MISVCADGASVNMGIYTDACTQIKNDGQDWFLKIHCAYHRLELAIGSAYTGQPEFQIVDTLLLNIYQLFKSSGKLRRLLTTTALNLGKYCISFVRSHYTRFQNHKYRATKALLINLVPLYLLCENMIAGGSESCHSAKTLSTLKGFFDKLQSYKYLAAIHFYRQAIFITAHLSFTMQKQCLITNIATLSANGKKKKKKTLWPLFMDGVQLPQSYSHYFEEAVITEFQSSECKLLFQTFNDEDSNIKIDAATPNLPANQTFKN